MNSLNKVSNLNSIIQYKFKKKLNKITSKYYEIN